MWIENKLKAKLKAGKTAFGTWSMLPAPEVINVISRTSLDFVIVDLEHGPMSFETVQRQVFATESFNCTPIVRLGQGDDPTVLRALDAGPQSLLVSHVSTAEEAERIVRSARYAPEGERGLSPFTRNHEYGDDDLPAKLRHANEQTFVGVLVEGEEGISNLESIASVKGLDMLYLGIYDISQAVGAPGDLTNPKVLKMLAECARVAAAHGLVAGSVARNKEYIKILHDSGYRFISYRVDSAILKDGLEQAHGWFKEETGRA